MALGLGLCGLSVADWRSLSPAEFALVLDARQQTERNAWERARMTAVAAVMPYCSKRISPQKLFPLPWDKESRQNVHNREKLTPEQRRRRVEKLFNNGEGLTILS